MAARRSPFSLVKAGVAQTTFTTSTAEVDTYNTTNVTQRVDTYTVQLKARIQGGTTVFDQTYHVAFSDALVLGGVAQAQAALTAVGAKQVQGPSQLSSSQTLAGSVTNTVQGQRLGAAVYRQVLRVHRASGSSHQHAGNLPESGRRSHLYASLTLRRR